MMIAGQIGSSALVQEDIAGACFKESAIPTFDTIDGPVSVKFIDVTNVLKSTVRGSDLWSIIYGNIKNRVRHQLQEAHPDLWLYVYYCVYGNVLSYTDFLDAKETSLRIISALIPQDVNPILNGHLKGALNAGATKEEVESVQSIPLDICDCSGNVSWQGGKKSVAKLQVAFLK